MTTTTTGVVVLKFGGTSVSSASNWAHIASVLADRQAQGHTVLVVHSALSGVTDRLEALLHSSRDQTHDGLLRDLKACHTDLARALGIELPLQVGQCLEELSRWSAGIGLVGEISPSLRARVLGQGELMATHLSAAYLRSLNLTVHWLDARQWLRTATPRVASEYQRWLAAACEYEPDEALLALINQPGTVYLTQGFIAGGDRGQTALLGRGGSDTSAAYFAAKLRAKRLEIWTDVPGMFSANPRVVKDARLLKHLHYDEAQEIASGGAKVLHPRCILPVKQGNIPLSVHATHLPHLPGTQIGHELASDAAAQVKAIVIKKGITLVSLDSPGMWHEVGFLASIFAAFRDQGLSIDLVATSETNVTVSLDPSANGLDEATMTRLHSVLSQLCRVEVLGPCAALSLVGARIGGALGALGVALSEFVQKKIYLVSQSANDINLTFVVDEAEGDGLLTHLHQALISQHPVDSILGPTWSALHDPVEPTAAPVAWWVSARERLMAVLDSQDCAYVYDTQTLRRQARSLKSVRAIDRVHYAIKANDFAPLLRVLAFEGLYFECVSRPEVEHVLAQVPSVAAGDVFFTPNFASKAEYAWAIATGVQLTLDNLHPLREWPELFNAVSVFVRVDTGVGRGHHSHVRTGGSQSKFGVPLADMVECAQLAQRAGATVRGLHAHVGSGVLGLETWPSNAHVLAQLAQQLHPLLPDISVLNLGGGLSVATRPGQAVVDLAWLDEQLLSFKKQYPQYALWIEPGRYTVAEAGVLLARVTQLKGKRDHQYVGVATGMNSLIRPALYDARHEIYNLTRLSEPAAAIYDVVGPICESGDVLGRARELPLTLEGDVLLIATAGAYGHVMSSNYNLRVPAREQLFGE